MTAGTMPQRSPDQIAESLWRQVKPVIVGVLDAALQAPQAPAGPESAEDTEAEARYVAERAEAQLERLRAKTSRGLKSPPRASRGRKES